jgi:HEAT repeat protein
LLAYAVDAEPTVRAAAMIALSQLGGPEHLPGMVQGILKSERGAERTAAERAVAAVCARITPESERAAPLIAILEKLSKDDRLIVMPALGRVGGAMALKVIEATIADTDAKVHEIGVRALCNWPDASTWPMLIELAKSDSRPELRTMALAALIRVAPLPDKRSDDERLELVKKVLAMCQTDGERKLILQRVKAIRTVAALRFVAPYMDQATFAPAACETVVELAHHRALRDANKDEFHQALDKVLATTKDPTLIDRANRYKRGQTWVKPMATE